MKIILLALLLAGCDSTSEFYTNTEICSADEIFMIKIDTNQCIELGDFPADCYLIERLSRCYDGHQLTNI